MRLVRCDGSSTRGPHSTIDIHLLSDHLSVTFPQLCPAWNPRVLDDHTDMYYWHVTGFWRGPRASIRLRQVLPYMMSDMRTQSLQSKTHSHLRGLMGTKRLIWESAQGPLVPAALGALCREWRLRVLRKPTGINIFSFLCGWCSYTEQFVQSECLRVLLKDTWARKILNGWHICDLLKAQ